MCKKYFKIILLVAIVFLLGASALGCSRQGNDGNLISMSLNELREVASTEGYGFVYISSPTCRTCQEFQPIVLEAIDYLDIEIYLFDTDEAFLESSDGLIQLMGQLGISMTPTLIMLNDGEIEDILEGIHNVEEVKQFFRLNLN